jgi:hypothetical protein
MMMALEHDRNYCYYLPQPIPNTGENIISACVNLSPIKIQTKELLLKIYSASGFGGSGGADSS